MPEAWGVGDTVAVPRAVLFDLYDTLVRRVAGGGRRAGVPPGLEKPFDAVWREWGERRMRYHVPFQELLVEVFRRAGRDPDPGAVDALAAERAATKAAELAHIEGRIISMLETCRSRGAVTAVVSGCAVDDVASWPASPLHSLVDVAVFSCDVGTLKPEPAIYHLALDRVGVAPEEAAFIDDATECVLGARDAGIATTLVATWFSEPSPTADPSIEAVAEPADVAARLWDQHP